jgi:phytanoyl-CoA hydroxylase
MTIEQALAGDFSFFKDPEAAMISYQEYGFHIEKDFFSHEHCDFLIGEGNNLAGARAQVFKPALMPHIENPIFFDVMKEKKTVEIIGKLVGGTPVGIQTQFFYCKPGTRGFSLHQDNFYIEAGDGAFASVWIGLVDSSSHNGGMIIYPGSHKEGNLPVRKLNLELDPKQDRNANNEETEVPSKYSLFNLTLSKGSALFLHAYLVHGSNSNQSESSRYAVLNLYLKAGEKFRSGNSAQRQPMVLI